MKNNINKLLVAVVFGLSITGCAKPNNDFANEESKDEVRGNCEVRECIKELKTSNSIEEINDVIGFEAEKSEYSESYKWQLSEKNWITLDNTGTSPILQATIDKSMVKNENNDFSVYQDIKKLLDSGKSLTYKEMVEKLGGVEGTLAGRTSTSDRYIWVDKNEQTFSATFSISGKNKGKCTIISLR